MEKWYRPKREYRELAKSGRIPSTPDSLQNHMELLSKALRRAKCDPKRKKKVFPVPAQAPNPQACKGQRKMGAIRRLAPPTSPWPHRLPWAPTVSGCLAAHHAPLQHRPSMPRNASVILRYGPYSALGLWVEHRTHRLEGLQGGQQCAKGSPS